MTHKRLNDLTGKAREGTLTRDEGLELCKEIHNNEHRLSQLTSLLMAVVAAFGKARSDNPKQIQLVLPDSAQRAINPSVDSLCAETIIATHLTVGHAGERATLFTYEKGR